MGDVQGLDDLKRTLSDFLSKAENRLPAMREIAVRLVSSIQQNFREGGRPDRWLISRRAKKEHGQTLLKSGRLMKSVTIPEITPEGITFGSNLPYAAIHQFGGEIHRKAQTLLFRRTKTGESRFLSRRAAERRRKGAIRFARTGEYVIRMPARPYIMFQSADVVDAGQILLRHLLKR